MKLSHEHHELQRSVKRWIDEQINPHVDEWEAAGIFPAHQVFKQMGDMGWLGLCKPTDNGGLGLDYSYGAVLAEALGHMQCGGVPMAIGVQTDMATPALAAHGSAELRAEFLTPAIQGELVACLGVSEVGGGSDVASIKTTAKKDGDGYLLNGEKMWITNGSKATWYFVLATMDPAAGHKAMVAFVIPANLDGIKVGKKEINMGQRCSDTRGIVFNNVKVSKKYLLGNEGDGFKIAMKAFDLSRPAVAALAVGIAQCAMDHAVKYALERKTFGKPIAEHQAVAFMIADMAKDIEAARLLVWKSASELDGGGRNTKFASFAKCFAGDIAVRITQDAVQIFGGYGYSNEYPVEKLYRDAKITQIYEGTQQIQRLIISRAVFAEYQKG